MKVASRLTKRSVTPRQMCDQSYLQNYPSDCQQALGSVNQASVLSAGFVIPAILCEPRCGQPAINFYISCGFDIAVPPFVAHCGTNAMGQRCGTNAVQMAVNATSATILANCTLPILGDNCTTECRDVLTSAQMSPLGCCLDLLNISAAIGISNPTYSRELWEQNCGVNLPSPCTSPLRPTITTPMPLRPTITTSTPLRPTITDGSVALVVSKVTLAVALLLLGTLVF